MANLSPETIAIIKSTIPVLKQHAEAISTKMYAVLFDTYPETRELFSKAPVEQPKILAAALSAYAMNIDNLDALSNAVSRMATTHVRSQVKAEHYPMVAEAIIEALKSVLGDAATPEILKAWGEAYFFLADILIEKEKALYDSSKAVT